MLKTTMELLDLLWFELLVWVGAALLFYTVDSTYWDMIVHWQGAPC